MGNAGICRVFGMGESLYRRFDHEQRLTDAVLLDLRSVSLDPLAIATSSFNVDLLDRVDDIARI